MLLVDSKLSTVSIFAFDQTRTGALQVENLLTGARFCHSNVTQDVEFAIRVCISYIYIYHSSLPLQNLLVFHNFKKRNTIKKQTHTNANAANLL